MNKEIELLEIDRRFEPLRLKDKRREAALLQSIINEGIHDGLGCVCIPDERPILIDGFKRIRCASKIGLSIVPVYSLGKHELEAILYFLRLNTSNNLSILEQAALVDQLAVVHGMSLKDIAAKINKSKAWVSIRLYLLEKMSATVREAVFSGKFPIRSYMYSLRPFTRVNGQKSKEVDDFVTALSGKDVSGRDIHLLAGSFFNGDAQIKAQICTGQLDWTLKKLKEAVITDDQMEQKSKWNDFLKMVARDFHNVNKYLNKLTVEMEDKRLQEDNFFNHINDICQTILRIQPIFIESLRRFCDRSRKT